MTKSKIQTLRNKKTKGASGDLNEVFLVSHRAAEMRVMAYARFRSSIFSEISSKYVFDNVGPLVGKKKKGWSMLIRGSDSQKVEAKQSA